MIVEADESEDKGKHYRWDEGLPTKPDVDLLLKTWPKPEVGDRFPYEAIEALLHIKWTENRFRTVTANWRARMAELGFVVECEAGKAFYCATADQISAGTHGTLKFIGHKAHKQRKKLARAKIENEEQRPIIEHHARLMFAVERDSKKARMNLIPPTLPAELPKISPPKKKGTRE